MNAARRYARTQAETASSERILVLLFEEALRSVRAGIAHLEAGERREASERFARGSEIVMGLHGALDRRHAPELCDRLADLYVFAATRLVRAGAAGDAGAAREAERVLVPVADAFRRAVDGAAA